MKGTTCCPTYYVLLMCQMWVLHFILILVWSTSKPGLYTICHYINQDVFSDHQPQDTLYGSGNFLNYRVDQNCSLIWGWAKHTNTISGNQIPCWELKPTLAMFDINAIVSTCVGIEGCVNDSPHSYIFFCKKQMASIIS